MLSLCAKATYALKHRVATRDTNIFGKSPDELKLMLYWRGKMVERYEKLGAAMIDASQPLEAVVDEVIAKSEKSKA